MTLPWKTTVLTLPGVPVNVFNLGKYFLMTYFIGMVWDLAYISIIEAKRYLSLWHTGSFSVSSWGRSRNNLLSGSNFEFILAALRNRSSNEHKFEDFEQRQKRRNAWPLRLCVYLEIPFVLLILFVVTSEAMSELYTDITKIDKLFYARQKMPIRANSSKVIIRSDSQYSTVSDLLLARRCATHEKGRDFVVRPNLVIEEGEFEPNHGLIPRYNQSVICLHDKKDPKSFVEVKHSKIESQRKPLDLDTRLKHTFQYSDVQHRIYDFIVRGKTSVPHFSNLKPSSQATDLKILLLLLVDIEGDRFTCTTSYDWCLRVVGTKKRFYEIIYPLYTPGFIMRPDSANLSEKTDTFQMLYTMPSETPKTIGTMPIRVPVDVWPRLANDTHMMRPYRTGPMINDIVDNLHVLTIGYNFGWTTQTIEERNAIVEIETHIVPVVQLGYVITLGGIVTISLAALAVTCIFPRKRKIAGLLGEHAFIGRWQRHLEGDDPSSGIQERKTLAIVKTTHGVGHLQPPLRHRAIRLSEIEGACT